MRHMRRWMVEEQETANRRTNSLAGLAVTLFLVVLCLYLVQALRREAAIEDCMMSGRSNCEPLIAAAF